MLKCLLKLGSVTFDFLTAVTLKSIMLWDVTPYSLVEVCQNFREMYCLHLQGSIVSQVGKQTAGIIKIMDNVM
jgi:hypothetical protein